ncbi:MAG TPA: M28 family peptidase [Anaerolineales bacterium]|nr:M28 family peptidase [Anaerolineales bacterium]
MTPPGDIPNPPRSAFPEARGWRFLFEDQPGKAGNPSYPLPAYSEFMPAPRLGRLPYGELESPLFSNSDPFGWPIPEVDEQYQLKPGLERISRQVMAHLLRLGRGESDSHIGEHNHQNLTGNPYWPPELASRAGSLAHERYVCFLPFSLSPTQDDKGRLLWTLFGGSEQGPETVFWKGFFSSPGEELPAGRFFNFLSQLLSEVYGESPAHFPDLLEGGFRILPSDQESGEGLLPSWARQFLIHDDSPLDDIRYLLTFRPFARLPGSAKERYLAGALHLLPFPGSLVFWGMPTYSRLGKQLPLAGQIPLLRLVSRYGGPDGLRVPQSGWMHEPHPDLDPSQVRAEVLQHDYVRSHRWDRLQRFEDELSINPRIEKIAKVLFSTDLQVMGLYDKPMARNCQLWTKDFELLLDGPNATREELKKAEAILLAGGLFGYRFVFPAARVGGHEVYWHRPVVTYLSASGEVSLHPNPPLGYLTAYAVGAADIRQPIELWPRLLDRPAYRSALAEYHSPHERYRHQTCLNLVSLLDARQDLGGDPLPASFARALLRLPKGLGLEEWLTFLPDPTDGSIGALVRSILAKAEGDPGPAASFTYPATATRAFELAYWNDIQKLAEGEYRNKDNADCVQDDISLSQETCQVRDLDRLGDYLISRHRQSIQKAEMEGKAFCGELPFQWKTDFDFPLFGGWKSNQENRLHERNILVVIPGKNRREAVVLADHYDTAYMEDLYDRSRGGSGARRSAAGADDDYSATATLLQAAPIYLQLAREGRLERDIWLLHLTGEEFPADCLGARHFCQRLVEKGLQLDLGGSTKIELSDTRVIGVYVMDMIAHNRDDDRDIFQISPGRGARSLRLALHAHQANLLWNTLSRQWNEAPERKSAPPARRSPDGIQVPPMAPYPSLFGEVRTKDDPLSSLYNTDGQIFSDTGVPVVLFMENYDINRSGYHDSRDNMENIDLDYGAALAAIAIESCARVAADAPITPNSKG